jgi:dihydrofolate reductase
MRLVATEYLSLDGVFEEPGHWSNPWFNEQAGQFKYAELQASDALLLGRKTYEGFAAAWPNMKGTGDFGEKMNSMPKYVVSSTLDKVDWAGSTLLRGDVVTEVRRLKERPGKDLLLSGSAQLFTAMMEANLVDLYRIMLFPVVLGKGKRLFAKETDQRVLGVPETKTFGSGIVILEYRPKG